MFWNKLNIAWPCRPEPSSDWTVLTTALYAVLGTSGIKLSDTHSNSYHTVLSDEMIRNNDMEGYEGK